jgi:hypothetical protein
MFNSYVYVHLLTRLAAASPIFFSLLHELLQSTLSPKSFDFHSTLISSPYEENMRPFLILLAPSLKMLTLFELILGLELCWLYLALILTRRTS